MSPAWDNHSKEVTLATIKKKAKGSTAKPARSTRQESERPPGGHDIDDIAVRAYLRFIERGGEHGHDLEDWLAAERQLSEQA